jgi:nucleoside-diphosphate-sugar epimerase
MKPGPQDLALVTGATGFIGGRLVEHLVARGVRVRVLTSDLRHCSRVARMPVELRRGNLDHPATLAAATAGCSLVFHCAYRFGGSAEEQRRANVEGTVALARAALAAGARRFVHFSSVAAYGPPRDGRLDERTPPRPGDDYTNTKQAIELALLDLHRRERAPVVILQPTIVYGPFGAVWTTRLIEQLRDHRVALPRSGTGLCNAVYVDDVVQAALRASAVDAAVGRSFLVSGAQPVTWAEFYGHYERICGGNRLLLLDDEAYARTLAAEQRRVSVLNRTRSFLARRAALRNRVLGSPPLSWVNAAGRAILPRGVQARLGARYEALWQLPPEPSVPLFFPDPGNEALIRARQEVDISHARAVLGYAPEFDLSRGMELCGAWARWANLPGFSP